MALSETAMGLLESPVRTTRPPTNEGLTLHVTAQGAKL